MSLIFSCGILLDCLLCNLRNETFNLFLSYALKLSSLKVILTKFELVPVGNVPNVVNNEHG